MIIISARKFRDSQNEILKKALSEEVILTTLHFGNFRLVPIAENKTEEIEDEPVKKKSAASAKAGKPKTPAVRPVVPTASPEAGKPEEIRTSDNLLFPDLFSSLDAETKPAPDKPAHPQVAAPAAAPKPRARKAAESSRRRGKAVPSSVSEVRPDSEAPVMSNIPQWASGSESSAPETSAKPSPSAPAKSLAIEEGTPSRTGAAYAPATAAKPVAAPAPASSPAAAPAFEDADGDYSDRFDDNGNPRLTSVGKRARDTREDPMSEEERTAAFERLRERARQVREGAPQKASASESPAEPATHPSGPASAARPAAALHPDADAPAAYPEASAAEPNASAPAEPKTKDANVYVDPSLMSLDEYYKQAGIEIEPQKKGGFFSKLFGKK